MADGLVESAVQTEAPEGRRFFGVAEAQVISNFDLRGLHRVQLRLPWLPGVEPWARVAVPMAGQSRGTYLIPQIGDEVLVAFNHGDVRDAYVIGSLWNEQDRPPALSPTDAVNKRLIRTPLGQEIEIDDATGSITVSNTSRQTITIDPQKIQIQTTGGTATVTAGVKGEVSIVAAKSIELAAPTITLRGANVEVQSTAGTRINGGSQCEVRALQVRIN